MSAAWDTLLRIAGEEVRHTIEGLPKALRPKAKELPVAFESVPNDAILADGYEPDLLGLFVGPAYFESGSSPVDVPPQIILYLTNLWDFSECDHAVFREEVRTTYLHELGHYLGLDEDDLDERGLS